MKDRLLALRIQAKYTKHSHEEHPQWEQRGDIDGYTVYLAMNTAVDDSIIDIRVAQGASPDAMAELLRRCANAIEQHGSELLNARHGVAAWLQPEGSLHWIT